MTEQTTLLEFRDWLLKECEFAIDHDVTIPLNEYMRKNYEFIKRLEDVNYEKVIRDLENDVEDLKKEVNDIENETMEYYEENWYSSEILQELLQEKEDEVRSEMETEYEDWYSPDTFSEFVEEEVKERTNELEGKVEDLEKQLHDLKQQTEGDGR